ncbi:twin-arginine translocase subunit TatC [Listeria monocytogenes]|nr:twin-arginine translocase subunit TatC [Listeria monocytogenes]EBF5124079.1 twin-arginine translocase subunit TatC [Listeria monocytogenes]
MTEVSMSLTGHLKELRTRLLIILLSFFLAFFVGLFVAKPLILFLQKDDLPKEVILHVFKVTDAFQIYIEMAFVIGLVLVFPVILYQLWAFVKPGLHASEQRITLRYIPITFLLFLCGVVFSYVITFPFILKFMFQFAAELGVETTIGLATYFQFLLQIVLSFGVLFELPMVIMLLTRLSLITPNGMRRARKYAYFCLLIIAAFIAPPEILSHLMITIPLIGLYEISIVASGFTVRRMDKEMKTV